MRRLFIALITFVLMVDSMALLAQKDQTILTIGDKSFSSGEFWHVYNKNKHLPGFDESPNEFAERFINYKLKVVEAINQGIDTLPSFKSEYEKYANDLKASFMVDSAALESMAREAYSNLQQVVNASHILVALPSPASPSDTMMAYLKIKEIREKALKGDDFGELAVRFSQDPSAVNNKGELGYFSAFRMIYPFEKAAFSTTVGGISDIIRTDFGYHIIKVHEKFPNPGKIRVAHIMKMFERPGESDDEMTIKIAIDSIYQELQKGASFEKMAASYSDDKNSSGQAGEMRAFTLSDMVPEFALASFGLATNGAISEPVRTEYGWHIIKRLEHTPIGSFEDEYAHISTMMARDGRSNIGAEAFIKNKMKSSDFHLSNDLLSSIYELAQKAKDNETFFASVPLTDEVLVSYNEDVITVSDYIKNLESDKAFNVEGGKIAIDKSVEAMAHQLVMHVEERDLAKNDLKYKYLANEYFDGLLIFEISNNLIWQHVGDDTLALQNYYKNHLSEFTPVPVLQGSVCEVLDRRLGQRMRKRAEKSGEGDNLVQILKDMARKDVHYKCEEGSFKFAKGPGNPVNKKLLADDNVLKHYEGAVYWDGEIVESEPLPYAEALGEVMSHFQQWKEENWVLDLREKHQPKFEYELLNK